LILSREEFLPGKVLVEMLAFTRGCDGLKRFIFYTFSSFLGSLLSANLMILIDFALDFGLSLEF
jgi:hypothetical protein